MLEPAVFRDARGAFLESWHERRYAELGITGPFVQDNVSRSARGVLRGLHFQHPNGQGKLVQALEGELFDVAVDVRAGSPTFGQWTGAVLSADNARQFWIPEGFAHGFCVLSEVALFAYKCTRYYDRDSEHTVRWDDADIGIDWPLSAPSLSEKDRNAPPLKALDASSLPPFEP